MILYLRKKRSLLLRALVASQVIFWTLSSPVFAQGDFPPVPDMKCYWVAPPLFICVSPSNKMACLFNAKHAKYTCGREIEDMTSWHIEEEKT